MILVLNGTCVVKIATVENEQYEYLKNKEVTNT